MLIRFFRNLLTRREPECSAENNKSKFGTTPIQEAQRPTGPRDNLFPTNGFAQADLLQFQ